MDVPDLVKSTRIDYRVQGSPVAMMLNNDSLVVVSSVSSWNIADSDHYKMQWVGVELVRLED